MNIKDFKWTEKRFGTTFANILKKLGGLSKDGTDGSIEYKDDDGNVSKLVTDSNFSSLLAKNGLIEVKWQELKDKRDNGQLIQGALYRITDYQCTTTQENTQSAGHQFDIVLLALSENKLAEEGWAMMHGNIYDVTFADGVIKRCYIYEDTIAGYYYVVDINTLLGVDMDNNPDVGELVINEEAKTAVTDNYNSTDLTGENLTYNYFQNSNLSAWKVWYCLDNDKDRFAWADDNSPSIVDEDTIYVRKPSSDIGDLFAWYNENDNIYDYTKTEHPSIGDETFDEEGGTNANVSNVFGFGRGVIYRLIDEFNNDIKYDFKNIQFKRKLTNGQYDDTNGTETWCYTLNIWYEGLCQDASIVGNTLPNDEGYVNGVYDNVFGYATAYDLYIVGVNTFAFALGDNVVLSFDNDGYFGIYSNTIGDEFDSNTIGNCFYNNIIGNGVTSNIIGNEVNCNTIGNGFRGNIIGNWFCFNNIGHNCTGNTISDNFTDNKVGSGFGGNNISKNFHSNEIGTGVISTVIDKAFVQYIKIANGIEDIRITSSATTSQSDYLQNFVIGLGVKGVSASNRKTITHATVNDTKQTTYLPTNSTTINV